MKVGDQVAIVGIDTDRLIDISTINQFDGKKFNIESMVVGFDSDGNELPHPGWFKTIKIRPIEEQDVSIIEKRKLVTKRKKLIVAYLNNVRENNADYLECFTQIFDILKAFDNKGISRIEREHSK